MSRISTLLCCYLSIYQADLRFWDHENERGSEDFDNISLSSLLGHLDSFYGNKSQGATDTDENL